MQSVLGVGFMHINMYLNIGGWEGFYSFRRQLHSFKYGNQLDGVHACRF